MIEVVIKSDRGEVTDPFEQMTVLCQAAARADQAPGCEIRALHALAAALAQINVPGCEPPEGVALLLNAATVAAHELGIPRDDLIANINHGFDICEELETKNPRSS